MSTRQHGLFCAILTYLVSRFIKLGGKKRKKRLAFITQSQTIWSRAMFGLITVHHSECLIADLVAANSTRPCEETDWLYYTHMESKTPAYMFVCVFKSSALFLQCRDTDTDVFQFFFLFKRKALIGGFQLLTSANPKHRSLLRLVKQSIFFSEKEIFGKSFFSSTFF